MNSQTAVALALVEVVGMQTVERDATGLDELDRNKVARSVFPIPVGTTPAIIREQKTIVYASL